LKTPRILIAAAALAAFSSAQAGGFTLNDLVKATTGVDVIAKVNGAQASKYPAYDNGVELLTKPDADQSGVSSYLRAALKKKYAENPDAVLAASNDFKVSAEMLEVVRAGGKLTDAQLKKSAAADDCAARVLAGAQHVDASEGFEWQSDVWSVAYPPDMIAANASLKAANDSYMQLESTFGQQFEARKGKIGKLPTSVRQVCALAGVQLSAMGQLTKDEQVERDGSPSQLGIEHAMYRILNGGNQAVQTQVLSVEKLGCARDGTAFKCDISAHVLNKFYAPTVPGAKPLPPGENRQNVVDTYRLAWSNQSNEWLPITH
jgi:hypothetical protein